MSALRCRDVDCLSPPAQCQLVSNGKPALTFMVRDEGLLSCSVPAMSLQRGGAHIKDRDDARESDRGGGTRRAWGVRTWYDEHGEGEALALLHPGGADARAWAPTLDALVAQFHVFTPERRGHGRTPDVEGPINYELMAEDTIAFLEGVVGGPALLVALRRPDLARRVVLISGVFHRDGWVASAIDPDASPP